MNDTIPAPPPDTPNPADMLKAELERLREERDEALEQRDAALYELERAEKQVFKLACELEALEFRYASH